MERYEVVIRFFHEIGASREAEMYLRLFHKGEPNRFAVIEVAEDLSPFSINLLALNLAFLSSLDLYPVVVHASSEALNETLVTAINIQDGSAVGVTTLKIGEINRAIRNDSIPVVAAPGKLSDVVDGLVRKLRPRKIIRVTEAGGLRRKDGTMIEYLNLRLSEKPSHLRLARYESLLADLPPRSVVEITSASNLLRELFTQKGGGTLIKRGRELKVYDGFEGLSRDRLRGLIERSFGKRLARDYFKKPATTVIIDPDYKGIAIVKKIDGLFYLDKFAVRPDARGEGIAVDLWTILTDRHPKIFWRSRAGNSFNAWYAERATGMMKFPDWHVWWRGLSPRQAQKAVKVALATPLTVA